MKALILLITATVIAISSTVFADEPVQGGTLNSVIQPEPPGLMLGLVLSRLRSGLSNHTTSPKS